ncbi:DUF3800 domain-containing protein, partial [bacterium]|nr:DUF3800 domain-containing protein [bacterium]
MAYIFLDESGDLGFDFTKKKTSKYFVIVFLFVHNKGPIEKIIKKVFRSFSTKEIKRRPRVLHCYKETPKTRHKVLNRLNEHNVSVLSVTLNKKKVYARLHDEKHVLYNYVTNILLDRIFSKKLIPLDQPVHLIASKRETNRFLNDNFRSYLERQVSSNFKLKLSVEIKTPHEEKCLQVVDFVCWSLFRKKEHEDESYYNL